MGILGEGMMVRDGTGIPSCNWELCFGTFDPWKANVTKSCIFGEPCHRTWPQGKGSISQPQMKARYDFIATALGHLDTYIILFLGLVSPTPKDLVHKSTGLGPGSQLWQPFCSPNSLHKQETGHKSNVKNPRGEKSAKDFDVFLCLGWEWVFGDECANVRDKWHTGVSILKI